MGPYHIHALCPHQRDITQLNPPEAPEFRGPPVAPGGAIMAARSVGSLVVLALSACSGTLDGSDRMDVALLRSRRDDNAAGETNTFIVPYMKYFWDWMYLHER